VSVSHAIRAAALEVVLVVAVRAPAAAQISSTATVLVVDDEVRVRRTDEARARAHVISDPKGDLALVALRGETVAFQVIVVAGPEALEHTSLSLGTLALGGGAVAGPRLPRAEVFREHYLTVDRRSRNDRRPDESLGWDPEARPPDDEMLGDVPDGLLAADEDVAPITPGPAVPAGQTGAFWVDVFVPETVAPGDYAATVEVHADGVVLRRLALKVTVRAPVLPYRATGAFVFYEAERLERRMGNGPAVERQLWQLLHAHHLDALAPLTHASDITRLAAAYDGSLFQSAAGYEGPGVGVPPSVIALGAYGTLGAPTDESLARVDAMLAALPKSTDDVFLYAVDEQCKSPLAADWKRALAGRPAAARVRVGQTCDEPPARQAADVALVPAQAFGRAMPAEARAAGRHAWIYNGALPRTGTLLLDADPRGLVADGWISAAMSIERWFYWESTFWDDDNAGGRGPIEPFTTAETFHNRDGDAALGDGLLVYPGRQLGRFEARSLGVPRVLPSLRLKALRRGIEDAGLIALAARERPDEAFRLVMGALPAALDEARPDRPAAWDAPGATFTEARAALRALVVNATPLSSAEVRAAFDALAAKRPAALKLAPTRRELRLRRLTPGAAAILAVAALALLVVARSRRR
jgi:hypothetical protein